MKPKQNNITRYIIGQILIYKQLIYSSSLALIIRRYVKLPHGIEL